MIPESLGHMAAYLSIDSSGIMQGARTAIAQLETFSATLRSRGLSHIAVGVSIAAPLAGAVKSFADFERQMNLVSTVVQDSTKWMPEYQRGIDRLAVEVGESTDTLAKGLYDLLSSNIPAAEAMNVLAVAAKAAQGGATTTAVAVDALTTVLNSYGLAANQAADVSDWMFRVVEKGKITYEQLAHSIGNVATTANVAGVSLNEVGAAIATLTRVGISSDHAVTSLQSIISQFLKPTDEAAQVARSLGFELNTATLQAIGLRGVFEKLKGVDAETIAKLFPDVRGLRGVLPALQNIAGFEEDLAIMGKRAGAAETAYRKSAKGIGFAMDRAKQAVASVARTIGEALAPAIEYVTDWVTKHLEPIKKWIGENKGLVITVAGVAAGLVALGVTMLVLGTSLSVVTGLFSSLIAVVGFVLSPIGLLAMAVVGVGAALIWAYGEGDTWLAKITSIGKQLLEYLVPAFQTAKDFIIQAWNAVSFAIQNGALVAEHAVISWARAAVTAFNEIEHAIQQIPVLLNWLVENWRDIFQTALNLVESFAWNVGVNLTNLWESIKTFATGGGWSFEWQGLLTGFESTIKQLPTIAEREIGALEKDLQQRQAQLEGELAGAMVQHAADKAAQEAQAAVQAVQDAVAQATPSMPGLPQLPGLAEPGKVQAGPPLALRGSQQAYELVSAASEAGPRGPGKQTEKQMVNEQKKTNTKTDRMINLLNTIKENTKLQVLPDLGG